MNIGSAKWAASLVGVREVSLVGAADLGYWQARLELEGLRAVAADGRAHVMIIAADARFKGIRFRERSVSVLAAPLGAGEGPAGGFLVQAFNSNRLFAFVERRLFATPYAYGDVSVNAAIPASITLTLAGPVALHAEMFGGEPGAPPRTPVRAGDDGWEGAVYLPAQRPGRPRKFFFARVRGFTEAYEFQADDWLSFAPGASGQAIACEHLIASQFAPQEWLVRPDAAHAKSKTYAAT